ncbi:MAG: PKD domain-containing protein [Bacteroidota bacterium]|nr:PKD domain-containing protein [Bacteroidota bacterium]
MFHQFLRTLSVLSFLLALTFPVAAQPCADTQPLIAGPQVVSNNQAGVIYSTANIPGHTYNWTVVGGAITAGAGTNQITVLWGPIGTGTVSVNETNSSAGCTSTDSKTVSVRPLLISYFYYTNTSCYGDLLSFWDSSVADPANPIVSYYWDFGDGSTSTLQNPTHTYLPPYNTTWTVTYIVTNQQGQQDTIYDAVYVNPNQFIPSPVFSFNTPKCAYEAVPFNSSASTTPAGTGNIIHWDWNFGDPASGSSDSSNLPNPSHVFSSPGTYTVSLEITNERYCKNSISQVINVQATVPAANYSFTNPTCMNNPVSFTDLSTAPAGFSIATWEWNFADGSAPVIINAPSSPNISHIFTGSGPYNVKLTALTNTGCRDSIYRSVSLTPSPLASFQWDNQCASDTVHFQNLSETNQGPDITGYSWDFGDPSSGNNTSTLKNPPHVYINTGTYTIRLVATNTAGCPDTTYKSITIYPKPAVEYTFEVGSTNNEIDFHVDSITTNLPSVGYNMVWNFGDGNYGYGHNPVHVYMGSGNFNCILTVTDTLGCSNSVTHQVYVPEVPMAFYSSNSPVCLGTPTCFHDLSSVPTPPYGYIQTWQWDFGDGSPLVTINFPNNPDVCHTYAATGTYAVTLTTWDNSGFYDSYTHNQDVMPNPIANFQYSSACQNQVVQFTDASFANGGGNIITWDWNFGDPLSGSANTSAQQNPSHIFTSGNTTYQVRLVITNFDNCRDTVIKPVYVFPAPPVEFTHDTACVNNVVTFTANTVITHVDSISSWSWNFGDGSPASTDPVTTSHLYSSPGTYTATLTVVDFHGCINQISHTVKVNPLPIPQFTWNTPVCSSDAVHFTDQSTVPSAYTGYIAKWLWDFGDGTTQTIIIPNSPNVSHTFIGGALTHTVRLTVWTSDSCTQYIEKTVTSVPSPVANFEYSTVSCEKRSIQFTDLSQTNGGGAISVWTWNFDDPGSGVNNSSTIPNPVHVFATAGSYNVSLIIQNATGCRDTIVKAVVINPLPAPNFTADTACVGNPTQFTDFSVANAGSSSLTYSWNFGDGSPLSPQQNPTHTYATYGVYNVTLTITNANGCVKDTTKSILVNPLPQAAFSFSTPNCFGAVVSYTNLSTTVSGYLGSIVKWTWDFGDGTQTVVNFPNNPNVTHTFVGSALSHIVTLTVKTSDSCESFVQHTVTSIPSPVANYSYSTNSCTGQAVQFTDQSQPNGGGNIISWNWNFGDPASGSNNTSGAQSPVHIFTSTGSFTVTLIITNTSNCTDTMVKTVSVNMLPVARFIADTACLNSPTTFTDQSLPNAMNIVSWTWDFGDGSPISPLQNPTHTYINYGVYNVKLTIVNSNGCSKDTIHQVLVNPLPTAAYTFSTPNCFGAVVHYTDLSTTPSGYLGTIVKWTWDFGDGTQTVVNFPGNPSVNHTFAGSALTHTVRLTVQTSDSCSQYVEHIINSIPSPVANFSYPTITCSGHTTQFTDLSQANGGGGIVTWSWNFGDPASGGNNISSAQNPIHTFSSNGTYNVVLIVTNASYCTDTMTQSVTVSMLPVANFTSDTACYNSPTTFTDLSSPNAPNLISWTWDFGDGTPVSTQQNPIHTFTNYGVFNVKLTTVNVNGCSKDTTKQVLVNPQPVAAFNFSTPNCIGAEVQFTNLSTTVPGYLGSIVQWVWDFGDGTTQTINAPGNPNVNHTFVGGALNHTVTLTVTTSTNCVNSVTHVVTSMPSPLANFSVPNQNCSGQSVQFTDLTQQNGGSNIISWHWDFGDPGSGGNNISTAQNPIHYFSVAGTFTVTLIVSNSSSCTDTAINNAVTVNARPLANFSADTACLGSPTSFTDQSTSTAGTISAWLWNFGDGTTATSQNPTHNFSAAGVFNVTLTVTSSVGCHRDTIKNVLVLAKPLPNFTATAPSCASDSVQFTDLSTTPHGTITTWVWDFGDGSATQTVNFPNSPNVRHKYANGGNYNVILTITTSDNCQASKINPVIVTSAPAANFDFATSRCAQMPVTFTDISQTNSGPPVSQWLWDFGDPNSGSANTSNLQNPTHSFTTDGTFNVKLSATNSSGCTDTITKPVSVNQKPLASFSADTACFGIATVFSDNSTANASSISSWNWDFGDPGSGTNNTSTLQNPTHSFSSTGNFSVTLTVTNSNGCADDTIITVNVNPKPVAMFSASTSCINSPTLFTDLSTAPGSSIASWLWDFGDGSTPSTVQNPEHIYTASGTYNVKLVVANLSNCSDSITLPVVARPTPNAAFTYTGFFCPAGQVLFQDQSQGVGAAISEREWIFEPGYTSSGVNPTYVFPVTDTTYLVSLIVTDNFGCKDTISDSVYVKPGFKFTFTNDTVCLGGITHFQAVNQTRGDTLYSPFWDFGDPNSGGNNFSYQYNPTHKYSQPGSYAVKLRVMDSDNCLDSLYKVVQVYNLPAPAFTFLSTPCDSIIHFKSQSTAGIGDIASWEWNFGDGTPPLIIPSPGTGDTSHQYPSVGVYKVVLRITNSRGCTDTLSQNVELYPCIKASFTYNDTLLCSRYPVAFSDSSLPVSIINQWHWLFGDGKDTTYTMHDPVLVHSFDTPGVFDVKLIINATVNGKAFVDTASQAVVIHPTPLPLFYNAPVCMKQVTLFRDTSNTYGEPVKSWTWEFGDPASGTKDTARIANPSHHYDTAGYYNVKLVVINKFGCKDSLTKSTRVLGVPTAIFNHEPACDGNPTIFHDMTTVADTLIGNWMWKFGDVANAPSDTSTLQDPFYIYKAAGDYAVRLIVKDKYGCMDTVDSTVVVHVSPVSSFTLTENLNDMIGKIQLNNKSTGSESYFWDFGNGQHSSEKNPIATYTEDGSYTIMLISYNQYECVDTTYYKYDVLFKGLYIPNAFAPNTTNYAVRLFKPVGINLKEYHIEVFDLWGHMLWESRALDSQGRPVEAWDGYYNGVLMPQGTYMWKASATFIDDSIWEGSDIGKGEAKTSGTVSLIR